MTNLCIANTGSGKNLGDLAMLINTVRLYTEMGVSRVFIPENAPVGVFESMKVQRYPMLYQCLGRYGWLKEKKYWGSLTANYFIVINVLVCLMLAPLVRILQIPLTNKIAEFEMINAIYSSGAFVLNGGGYLTDKGKFECRCVLLMAIMAWLLGKKIILTGQGLGPFESKATKLLLDFVLKRAKKILLRDARESLAVCKCAGVDQSVTSVAGDDALSLPTADLELMVTRKPKLAVHFRISPFTENIESIVNELSLTIKQFIDDGWYPVFFILVKQNEWEREVYKRMIFDLGCKEFEIVENPDPRCIKAAISQCKCAIGIAYHFVVFALSCGVPVIALYGGQYYKQKMMGLLEFYDRLDWALAFEAVNHKILVNQLKLLVRDQNAIHFDLQERTKKLIEKHKVHFEEIYKSHIKFKVD